jgi:regulator of protease activity HflC (stomatin/prohibitin superfamily)
MEELAILLFVVALVLFVFVAQGVKIVRPYERGLIERLGKYKTTADPGLRTIIPFIESIRRVDMREQVVDVPPQEVITSDNVVVSVDAVVYYEATDPQRLVYNVANFYLAVTKLAQTNLRNVIGDMQLDQALTSRDTINARLREILDDATDKWGTRVVRVEIQRIDPPPDVVASMHNQMKAERERRAIVLTADGQREAAIARAEGEKAAAILSAEGVKQRDILTAEGQAQAMKAVAEAEAFRRVALAQGEATATQAVFSAIHEGGPTPDLIAIKYLEMLGQVANGRATKVFLPLDTSGYLGSLAGIAELFKGDGGHNGGTPGPGGEGPRPASPPSIPPPAS